ncbi:hypothetical protein [Bacillus sp. FJAT-29814]|uniref:hypothetical protein n=1 Tax=Bacillus sp. FJAT-29814 TaxID=1729688 RepID=UPI000833B7A1|nr:hypothetical protein [Bacillus sp. FJAT-29814]
MQLTLGTITITKTGQSAGVFLGKTNTLKQFHSVTVRDEVVGSLTGDENTVTNSSWVKTKTRKEESL